ncbi:MAG: amino acid ABC transporter substrate-binding protein [Syntrophobacterales bacterium]|jgi:branched-chain amino acid transport system substrate-binding protein|nr:amino acid ABC transporter substrate-binding protein [Syntrophobacterales bacterium]
MKRTLVFFGLLAALGLVLGTVAQPTAAAAAEKTILIGFTASQTGKFNVEAIRQINGLNLWMEQVNAAGGIKLPDGTIMKVASKFYDDESKKERVQELYTKLISTDKADFLISPYSSPLTDAAAVIAQQYNKIMITTGAASDSTYKKGYSLVYQTYTPASRYLTGAVDVLAKLVPQGKKIAIIHEKDKFSTDVVNALRTYAEKKGYQVVLFEGYDAGTTDFAPFINKIPAGVNAVMGGGHFADTTTLARQLYEKKINTQMIALLVAPPEPKFAELGEACISVIGSSQWEPGVKYSPEAAKAKKVDWFGPSVDEFVKAYKAKYNESPSYHSAGGYVSGLILQQAIQKAGSMDTAKVKAALDAMNAMAFYGDIKFATDKKDHGLQEGHEMVYIQWQKDKQGKPDKQIVWPQAAATANPFVCPAR